MKKSRTEQIIEKIEDLPALPKAVNELIAVMENPDSTVNNMVRAMDTSICAKILRIANSAFYRGLREVRSIEHAIAILGRDTIRDLVLGLSIIKMFKKKGDETFDYEKFWSRSVISGLIAKMFGQLTRNPDLSKLYTIGLIHDMGEIVFFSYFPEEYKKVLSIMQRDNVRLSEAEERIFGISHPVVGGLLAEKWKLPKDIVRIITYHEDPHKLKDNLDELRLGMIIHSADILANELVETVSWDQLFGDEDRLELLFSGVSVQAVNLMKDILTDSIDSAIVDDWTRRIENELVIVSRAISPIMATLLTG